MKLMRVSTKLVKAKTSIKESFQELSYGRFSNILEKLKMDKMDQNAEIQFDQIFNSEKGGKLESILEIK